MKNTKIIQYQKNIFAANPCKDNSNCIQFYIKHKNVELTIYAYILTGKEANKVLQQQSLAISSEDEAHQRAIIQPTHFELGLFDGVMKESISPDDMLHTIGMMLAFSYAYWQQWLKHNNKTEVYFLPRAALVNVHNHKQRAEFKKAMQEIGGTISDALINAWNRFKDDKTIVKEFVKVYLQRHKFFPVDGSFLEQ